MNRKLGVLIPIECLDNPDVAAFCEEHKDEFSVLIMETSAIPRRKPKNYVRFAEYSKEDVSKISSEYGIPAQYINVAIWFHEIFLRTSPTKTLKEADLLDWAKTVRLIFDNDNRSQLEMIRLLDYLRWMETLDKDEKDRFWLNTVNSVAGVRKHWEKIVSGMWKMDKVKAAGKPAAAAGY